MNVKVHVTDGSVTTVETIGTQGAGNFDTSLGFLTAGQTIYVGVGAGDDKGGNASNPFDFSIRKSSGANGGGNGSVQINADNSLTYIPNAAFVAIDTFDYQISDGRVVSILPLSR